MKNKFFILLLFISVLAYSQSDYETNFLNSYINFEKTFLNLGGDYGTTFFPFLLFGYGGRLAGLSGAFTGVADDISSLEKNPAGTSTFDATQVQFSHTKLISDVNYNTLAYSMRFNDLGFGIGARVLYLPFTHFDKFGDNVGSGIITNSVITLNASYNFFRSYNFFGLSVGGNVKLFVYGIPEAIAQNQTRINAAFDLGILTKFNFLKAYNKVDKNFSIGLTVRNLAAFTDGDPPPTTVSIGFGYRPIEQLLISTDFDYLINYSAETYKNWSVSTGIEWKFTQYTSLLAGFILKSSPGFSLGLNLDFEDFTITVVYNPDFADVSKFSISASLKLGDLGRGNREFKIKQLYSDALKQMLAGNYNQAISLLKEVLKIDSKYSPAIKTLKQCEKKINDNNELNDLFNNKKLQ